MKRVWMVAAVAVLGMMVWTAVAQEADEPAAPTRQPGGRFQRGQGAFGGRGQMGGGMGQMVTLNITGMQAVTDLTEAQKKEIAELQKAAMEKMQEIKKQMETDVKRVLTPEQAAKLEAAQKAAAMRGPGGVTLTEAQMDVLETARANAAKVVDDPEARAAIMRKAYEEIQATYTEAQKAQAAAGRGNRGARGARGGNRPGARPAE